MDGWMTDGWIHGWMDGQMDGWMDRWMDTWMDGWILRKDGSLNILDQKDQFSILDNCIHYKVAKVDLEKLIG